MQFWNELMSSLLITIWIGKYVHMDQTEKGSQRPSSSNPQPLAEEAATFIMFMSPSKEYLHEALTDSHILIYFVQMIVLYLRGVKGLHFLSISFLILEVTHMHC